MRAKAAFWTATALVSALLLGAAGASQPAAADPISVKPANPQPAADTLTQGLAAEYIFRLVRSLYSFEDSDDWRKGKPLQGLRYRSGAGGVLTSGQGDGVCARITGFIKLDQPGRYLFATQSNDGVRVTIDNQEIIEDDGVHADQFSSNAEVTVTEAGWYTLQVLYFERKNTSTLELYWQPPDKQEFSLVPSEAFAYVKS
jgi:hypothetical protein